MPRIKGDGSIYQDGQERWTGSIELPSQDGRRRRKVVRRTTRWRFSLRCAGFDLSSSAVVTSRPPR